MKLSSIVRVVHSVWRARWEWRRPGHVDALIFDREGSEDLAEYLDPNAVAVLNVRGESYNLWAAAAAVWRWGFRVTMKHYCASYVKMVRPKVLLTFIDNTATFYELKQFFPAATVISVQNGWRDDVVFAIWRDREPHFDGRADYLMCFGPAIGRKYLEAIGARMLPIGSFKNNKVPPRLVPQGAGTVLFVSQFRAPVQTEAGPVMPVGEREMPWTEFYSAERELLPLLLEFTRARGLRLQICGCSAEHENAMERRFFEDILGSDGDWMMLYRSEKLTSYAHTREANFVVSIDSTLGVEAIGGGAKVAFFGWRSSILGTLDRSYGWEAGFGPQGPFWTASATRSEFDRVMHFLVDASEADWQQARRRFVEGVIEFDPGNRTFLQLMRDLGVPLNGEYCSDVR